MRVAPETNETPEQPALLPLAAADVEATPVTAQCRLVERDGLRVAMVAGSVFHVWPAADRTAEDLFVVQARLARVATIEELAAALGRPARTLYRLWATYGSMGAEGLVGNKRGPKPGAHLDAARDATIRRLHGAGLHGRAIARELGCSPVTVTRALDRMRLEPNRRRQARLPSAPTDTRCEPPLAPASELPAERPPPPAEPAPASSGEGRTTDPDREPPSEPLPTAAMPVPATDESVGPTLDTDPFDRRLDRALAAHGELVDAVPLFAPGRDLPYVGVLLALPGLERSGLLRGARRLYGSLGPAFYGLRTTLLCVVLLALLRLKRPEHLKEVAPPVLGRVIGLDRAPEVKTLRRKLRLLAEGPSEVLAAELARRRTQADPDALAFLYVDGHVRVYNGTRRLPAAHVARMRISLPATQDVWVHDGEARPILFVTQEAHPSLATALLPVLDAVEDAVGHRKATVVFDRGGWSPALFTALVDRGYDLLTYRKGPFDPLPASSFEPHLVRADEPPWLLHDSSVRIAPGQWMRQVTRLSGTHQTAILTTRHDLDAATVARRMTARWAQENFFKYMREEYALDALVEHGAEPDDPRRSTPNPLRTGLDTALRRARLAWQAALGAAGGDAADPKVRAHAERVAELRRQRNVQPRRVDVADLATPTARLPARRKNLYDTLKLVAWQIETDLYRAVAPYYRRADEDGRTLITAALHSAGHIELTPHELRVTLCRQSSPHRTRAIAEICRLLDDTQVHFPGTRLRVRYAIDGAGPASTTANSH